MFEKKEKTEKEKKPEYAQPKYEQNFDRKTGYVRCLGCGVTLEGFGNCPRCNGKNFWTRGNSYIHIKDSDTEGVTASVTRYQEDNVEEETESNDTDDEKMTAIYRFSCGEDLEVTMTETQLENLGNGVVEFGVMMFAFWLRLNPGAGKLTFQPPTVNQVKDYFHDLATRY